MSLPDELPQTDATRSALRAIYNWNYEPEVDALRTLYAKSLDLQWIGMRDLPWEQGVDREAFSRSFSLVGLPIQETRFWKNLSEETRWEVSRRTSAFLLSNFLHGEQGALMVASQLVSAVPSMDAKFYAATQTIDEARHVEVFAAYIRELDHVHPIMAPLKELLDATIATDSWMKKLIGMQVVVEGLALFVFRDMRNASEDPLFRQLLTNVSRDEARHTAYGVKYLAEVVPMLSEAEKGELEDFAFECTRMLLDSRRGTTARDAVLAQWGEAGLDVASALEEIGKDSELMQRIVAERGETAGVSAPVRAFIIPQLRAVGLFSERIEGHFREMFTANFGEERARLMDLGMKLPDDMDAWVESGI